MGHLAAIAVFTCLSLSPAFALTQAEEGELRDILARAADTSEGIALGSATVTARQGHLIRGGEACRFSRLLNADDVCTTSAILFPREGTAIDSVYYAEPEDIGYVNMDDWTEDVNSQIDEIWESYVIGSKAQSERIGFDVVPLKWVLYPTLDKASKVMTYGILLDFGGEEVINLTTIKFTRTGYVTMGVVTDHQILSANRSSFSSVSNYAAATYKPADGSRYVDFQDGDKIAAVGAVGVLASAMGVKYGNKGTFAAIGAMLLAFAKKFWFMLLAVPAILWGAVKRLAGGDRDS